MSVAATYAEAVFEAATDLKAVDDVGRDLRAFADAVAGSDDLRAVLDDPNIDTAAKKAVVARLTEGSAPVVGNVLQVLLDRGRMADFPDILDAFEGRVAAAAGRLEVRAITAVPLPDDLRARIVAQIKEKTGADIDLTESVDPEIVGGLVLQVGESVVDASVRHRIEELREAMRSSRIDSAVTS